MIIVFNFTYNSNCSKESSEEEKMKKTYEKERRSFTKELSDFQKYSDDATLSDDKFSEIVLSTPINIRTPQGLWDEALCQSIFTLRPGSPEGLPCYRTLFILFPAWGGHSQSHLLFMLCSFKFNSAVHYCNLIAYYVLF